MFGLLNAVVNKLLPQLIDKFRNLRFPLDFNVPLSKVDTASIT